MKKVLLVATVALFAALPAGVASASPLTPEKVSEWPFDSWNNAAWSAVASSPATGNSLVVYFYQATSDATISTGGYYAQLLDPAGKAIGSPGLLSDTGVNIWKGPAVAWNPKTGGWLACWSEEMGGGAADSFCKEISAGGEVGPSYPRVVSLTNVYVVNSIAWNPSREEFLVTAGAGSSTSGGAFVKSSGELSESIDASIAPTDWGSCGGANVAYSPTSKVFGVAAYTIKVGDARCAPWFWMLDSNGNRITDPVRIDPDDSIQYKQQSIAWSAARNEFVVMSARNKSPDGGSNSAFVIQRYNSADGQAVGPLQEKAPDSTYLTNRWRPILIANPVADQMRAFVTLIADDADDQAGLYSMAVDSDGTMSDPELVAGGETSFYTGPRPWWGFNPGACNYLGTFRGVESSSQLYTARYTQPLPCKSDLSITKSGTGSGSVAGTATDSSALSMKPEPVTDGTTQLYRTTSVTLEATPSDGSTFEGWAGACSGTGSCTVAMNEARSVTATFTKNPSPTPPAPSNAFAIQSSKTRGSTIVTRVRVPGAGKISQRSTYRTSGAAATKTACKTAKSVAAAGSYTLTCKLDSAARKQRRKGVLRVRVLTTFTPSGGTGRSAVRTVVFRSLKPRFTG